MRINPKLLSGIFVGLLVAAPLALHAQAPAGGVQPAPTAQAGGRADAATPGATGRGAAAPAAAGRGAAAGGQAAPGGVCNAPCDPYPGMKKLLVVADVSTGYDHDAINHTMGVIEQMGRESGIWVTWLRSDSQLLTKGVPAGVTSPRYANRGPGAVNKRNLNYFDAVMMLGSGDAAMSDQQKADLLSFIKEDGKGLILGHAEGVNFLTWPEFGNMIGGYMANEFPASGMWTTVVDPKWTAAAAFGKDSFFWTDQWPVLTAPFTRGSVHTIIAMDASKMTPEQKTRSGRTDNYYPIVWAKNYGKGRVFDFTGGHNDSTLDDPRTRALLMEGIKWALGLTNEDATPDKK